MSDLLTRDAFLGGRLTIAQPKTGYRAGVDPVFLAASVPARPGERVLDLGCGVGTAALCLGARVSGVDLTGLEIQEDYADLAKENAKGNRVSMEVVHGDVLAMPKDLRSESFDHVLMNPPYFEAGRRTPAENAGRETALAGADTLSAWCDAGLRRLKPGGWLSVIQVPERLPALLAALDGRAALRIHPLAPRDGRDASRVIVLARKGGGAPARLAAPIILHKGDHHEADGESYTETVRAVLRDGAPWPWVTH